eukprot:scaffold18382_cov57-Attheya_sp.AAC.1
MFGRDAACDCLAARPPECAPYSQKEHHERRLADSRRLQQRNRYRGRFQGFRSEERIWRPAIWNTEFKAVLGRFGEPYAFHNKQLFLLAAVQRKLGSKCRNTPSGIHVTKHIMETGALEHPLGTRPIDVVIMLGVMLRRKRRGRGTKKRKSSFLEGGDGFWGGGS